ncbi:hypothetical protein OnM2_060031 [Erysiphe neolycopersici]|uniref:Uncharacterized protein n=1 Tax=Erysiphe neolycopersici TaxID=212602 RepID=A0A420HPM9_9PEZI|nr:hypothetical protein OnM2_060031 [Erysiphe neolycopersici]
MLVNLISWAALLTFAVATSFPNRYSTRTLSPYSYHSVTTSAPYNHYSMMTSGISSHYDISISVSYSHYAIVSPVPYSHHNSATMIGSAITSRVYSSKSKVTYSYIISSTKYPGSMTSGSIIRPTGSPTKPLASYSYVNSPYLTTTISHSATMTRLPTVSSTKALTAHSRYNTTAMVHSATTSTISKSLMQPTDSNTEPLASYSYIDSQLSSTTISHSTNMTRLPAVSLSKELTAHSGHNTTVLIHTAIMATISRSLMRPTGSHIAFSIPRTYIASSVLSVNAIHSVSMTVFPNSYSTTSVISSTIAPYMNKSTDGSYSHTSLPTKSYYTTSCTISGTRCISSQFSSLVTTLPKSNLIYHSNSMISESVSSIDMSRVEEDNVDSPTKTSKDTPTAALGQPQESSTGVDSHVEAASSRYSAPIFLLISDIIILIMVLH